MKKKRKTHAGMLEPTPGGENSPEQDKQSCYEGLEVVVPIVIGVGIISQVAKHLCSGWVLQTTLYRDHYIITALSSWW